MGRGDVTDTSMKLGQPAGSAVPLVWAHAEYLKLLRSAVDGKVFDRIDPVYERYCEPEGREGPRCWRFTAFRRPIQTIAAGRTLRILDERRFEVRWTVDGWKTTNATPSRSLGSAGYSADVAPGRESGHCNGLSIGWSRKSWLGHNVEVKIDAE